MRVGVLGSGSVGRALAEGFTRLGHEVTIGTRDVDALMARDEPDQMGRRRSPPGAWSTATSVWEPSPRRAATPS
jgi:predicted dinucleotide-binding enzyme